MSQRISVRLDDELYNIVNEYKGEKFSEKLTNYLSDSSKLLSDNSFELNLSDNQNNLSDTDFSLFDDDYMIEDLQYFLFDVSFLKQFRSLLMKENFGTEGFERLYERLKLLYDLRFDYERKQDEKLRLYRGNYTEEKREIFF